MRGRGIHGVHPSLTADGKYITSDPMGWPDPGRAPVVRYSVADAACDLLAAGSHDATDHAGGCHLPPWLSADEQEVWFNVADLGVPQLYALSLAT